MNKTPIFQVLVAACLVVAWLACDAGAEVMSRVELIDGTVYENADITVDEEFKVVSLKVGDWSREISFSQIARLIDANGVDVTEEILEGRKPTGQVTAPNANQTAPAAGTETLSKRRKWPLDGGFTVYGHPSFLIGTWWEGFDTGIGFGMDGFVAVGKQMAIRGMVTKTGISGGEMWGSPDLSVWRYFLAFQYYNWPKWRSGTKTYYYFYTGLGAASHSAGGWSSTKFAQNLGGGLTTMLSQTIGLDISGCMDVLYIGSTNSNTYTGLYGDYQTALIMEIRVGLTAVLK